MPTLQDRISLALRDVLTALFSSPTRKLCVLAHDGTRVMRFDANTGGFIDQFCTFDPEQWGFGMCFGIDGHLLVPMSGSGYALPFDVGIQRFHGVNGGFIDTFAAWPQHSEHPTYDYPDCITLGPDGHLYAGAGSAYPNGATAIYRFNARTGAFIDVFVPPRTGGLECVGTLRFGPDGNLYVRNCWQLDLKYGQNILRFNGKTGAFMDVFVPLGEFLTFYGGMAFGPDGNLYVGELVHSRVQRHDGKTGALIDIFVKDGQANYPCGLAFAGGDLYVANNGRGYQEPRYGNVSRYDGKTGELVQLYLRLGEDIMHPTDVVLTVMDVPFPNFANVVGWRNVPIWVQVIVGIVVGMVVGRVAAPRTRR